jgi:subtilase family serine protease
VDSIFDCRRRSWANACGPTRWRISLQPGSPADFYPEPGETVVVTAMVRNRADVAAPKVVVALFGDNVKIGSETVDLAGGETRTPHFSWQPKAKAQLTLRVDPDQALA